MAVRIRLKRMGAKKRPFYRIVVANSTSPRDGRFIEQVGYYDPMTDPSTVKIDAEKALLWLGRGAQPSDTTADLFRKAGIIDQFTAAKAEAASKNAEAAAIRAAAAPPKAPPRKRTAAPAKKPPAPAKTETPEAKAEAKPDAKGEAKAAAPAKKSAAPKKPAAAAKGKK